jgi:hypothetical protein
MMRRINPRMVKVTITSTRVNPVVVKAFLGEVDRLFLNLRLTIVFRPISFSTTG